MVLLSILALLCPSTWRSDENVDCPHLYHVITWPEMVSCTLMVGALKYLHLLGVLSALIFILWGCCPMVLLFLLAFLCPPTRLHSENVDCPHLYHVITWPEMISCTLMVEVEKYFHLLRVLSALIFILWGCCPMVLLSILAFLCPPTRLHDKNVDCPHLYHVITWPEMISCTLMVEVEKYFHLLGVLSALIFILWGCCPMVLLSILTFLCPPTCPHDENVDCPHLYHVITWKEMGSCTLMFVIVKYFHLLGVLSALIFILWGCCPMVLLFLLAFLCPPTRLHDENVDCPHLIVHLDGWSSKIFSSFRGFVRLDFYPLGLLSYGAFVYFGFSLSAHLSAWRECLLSTPASCDHMTRNGVVQLDGLSRKIFSSFGIIVRLDFYPLGLLSYGAFVHFGFSLSTHVTAWRECWLSTPVSCDHMTRNGIVRLDVWISKILSSFGGFLCLDFYPLYLFSYGAFVNFGFSLSAHVTAWRECWLSTPVSCDHMTRNGIVHLDGWSSKIFSSFGGFVCLDIYPLRLLSYGAFVHFGFSMSAYVTTWRESWLSTPVSCDHMTRNEIVHLDGWSIKIFSSSGGFVRLDFYPLGLLSYGAFVHFGFTLSTHVTAWWECWLSTPVSCDHMTRNGIVHLDGWSIKIFASFGGLSALIFIIFGCCPMVLLFILALLCPPTWPHDENVDCPHLYHVITWPEMGSCTLMVGVVKYLYLLGVLSALIFILWGCCPMVLLCVLAFQYPPTWPHDENGDFPQLYHVITWSEMGSCTLMVGVVKYLHLLSIFCLPWFLSFGAVVLWCFCPFCLYSVRPLFSITRMLIVHTCIIWSHDQKWDRGPWSLE